jgi:ADP-heptose:LPS heptosyltransferase
MIGGPKDAAYTNEVIAALHQPQRIRNLAGKTTLPQLVELFSKSKMLFSSDSGPAHLGNAAGLPVVVLFGAGNENETSPKYKASSQVMRLGKLSCEPCVRNECKFGIIPPCLNDLDDELVIQTVLQYV